MRHIVSITDFSKKDILEILSLAKLFKHGLKKDSLQGKIIATCFFENSTRTRLSFEAAIAKLGGKTIGFADSNSTSLVGKGESLFDTFKILNCYADALIIRHPQDGAARLASEICTIPVINAGDGANQHPTQTLLDLFSILDSQGTLEGINLAIMGDLKHSRTVHSLISAAKIFHMKLFFVAPKMIRINDEYLFELKTSDIEYSFHLNLKELIDKLDCLYLTRLQKERFVECNLIEYYKITLPMLATAKPNLKILHPLPRKDELPLEIDDSPYAYYFQQAANGMFVRQALLDTFI